MIQNRATKWSKIVEKRGPEMAKNRIKNIQKPGRNYHQNRAAIVIEIAKQLAKNPG